MQILEKAPDFGADVYVAVIDGRKSRVFRSFYNRIAKALLFPDYFGRNLDALFDCLCSLEVLGKKKVALVIVHADDFLSLEKTDRKATALAVIADAEKKENRYDGVQFTVYLVS